MKAYTDLEQSKKLAEFLSLESADLCYIANSELINIHEPFYKKIDEGDIPCWSLAALLNIIPNSIYDNTDEYSQLEFSKTSVAYHDMNDGIKVGSIKDNLVDACYEMILKLHERKLLLHKYDGANIMFTQDLKEEMFPELKENEDERIRGNIIATIHLYYGEPLEDEAKEMIAWLEKQGEQKPADTENGTNGNDREIPISEQKPNTDFSDLRTWKYIVDAVWTEKEGIGQYLDSPFTEEVAKKLQKRFGNIEQKPAWSEEDEMIALSIEQVMNCASLLNIVPEKIDKIRTWLKSLKYRVQSQPKQEWSEGDERTYKSITYSFANNYPLTVQQQEFVKSLKERYTWKPSDEQMKELRKVFDDYSHGYEDSIIESLYNDLKKLKA